MLTLAALLLGITLTVTPPELGLGGGVQLDVAGAGSYSVRIHDGARAFDYRRLHDERGGRLSWTPTHAGTYTIEAIASGATATAQVVVRPARDGEKELGWRMETPKGAMVFRFRPDVAPNHVAQFAELVRNKFFDGLGFHRVIQGFMAQGGDPLGNGEGGPGFMLPAEFSKVPHVRGTLSTARDTDPDTGGSQFFICFKDVPRLDGKYTVFGQLVDGDDTLKAIEAIGSKGDPDPPTEIVKITQSRLVPLK